MPFRQQRPGRPTQDLSIGTRGSKGQSLGKAALGALGALVGGVGLAAGGALGAGNTSQDSGDSSGDERKPYAQGDGSSQLTPPMASNTAPQFQVNNPALDYIFNRGQGHLLAQQANIQGVFAKNEQDFQLKRDAILHDQTLDTAQKESMLRQAEQTHNANTQLLVQNNILATPQNQSSYDQMVSPIALAGTKFGQMAKANLGKNAAQSALATGDAQDLTYPSMVDTAANTIKQGQVASQGALANQPLANAANKAQLQFAPSIARAEASKAPLMPIQGNMGTSLFNTVSGKYTLPPGQGLMGIMNMFNQGSPAMTQGATGNPMMKGTTPASGNLFLPDGSILLPDGTKMDKDGNIIPN